MQRDRSLSIKEYRNLVENLEHNRILAYYDRQCVVFNNFFHHKDDSDDFTHDNNGLTDEIRFVSVTPYTNDKSFHEKIIGQLTLFGLGFSPTQKDWGGYFGPPPNLAISGQMMMKLGKDILWVEIFTNRQPFLMMSSSC